MAQQPSNVSKLLEDLDPDTQKTVEEAMNNMPDAVRNAITTVDWPGQVMKVGKTFGLKINQIGSLEIECFLVLIGLSDPDDFPGHIEDELDMKPDMVKQLIPELNEKVFKPIHEAIYKENPDLVEEAPEHSKEDRGEDEGDLDRDQVLQDIEQPAKNKKETISSQKLQGTFTMHKGESSHSVSNNTQKESASSSSQEKTTSSNESPQNNKTGDPYHESIDQEDIKASGAS